MSKVKMIGPDGPFTTSLKRSREMIAAGTGSLATPAKKAAAKKAPAKKAAAKKTPAYNTRALKAK